MASFYYEALDTAGNRQRGRVDADSPEDALVQLHVRGLYPEQVTPVQTVPEQHAAPPRPGTPREFAFPIGAYTALAVALPALGFIIGGLAGAIAQAQLYDAVPNLPIAAAMLMILAGPLLGIVAALRIHRALPARCSACGSKAYHDKSQRNRLMVRCRTCGNFTDTPVSLRPRNY